MYDVLLDCRIGGRFLQDIQLRATLNEHLLGLRLDRLGQCFSRRGGELNDFVLVLLEELQDLVRLIFLAQQKIRFPKPSSREIQM